MAPSQRAMPFPSRVPLLLLATSTSLRCPSPSSSLRARVPP
uniref:Uncharacterized protein n=1 Tax=Arundo donax TaxID=35708 RepID=A0A0A9A226_ARUDO